MNNPAGVGATLEEHHQACLEIFQKESFIAYSVFQLERAPTTGTIHAQAYVQLHNPADLRRVKRELSGRAACFVRKGSHAQAVKYCTKEDSRAREGEEFGEPHDQQGSRTDLAAVKDLIDAGASELEVASEHFSTWTRSYRALSRYRELVTPQRNFATTTLVFWGPSGSGKSRQAQIVGGPDAYWLAQPNGQRAFWDGYVGQETVVIDEFYGWLPYSFLLRLLDRYPLRIERKGDSIAFTSKRVIITSNLCPTKWYKKGLRSLRRRLAGTDSDGVKLGEVKYCELGEAPVDYVLPADPVYFVGVVDH